MDPLRGKEIIGTERVRADLEGVNKRILSIAKKAKGADKEAQHEMAIATRFLEALEAGRPARTVALALEEQEIAASFHLLTLKPVLYVCNVSEADAAQGNIWSERVRAMASEENSQAVVISASIEAEISLLESADEKKEFLDELGLTESGLDQIIRTGYTLLNLLTFFTVGPQEARAWTAWHGATAPQAAGCIHTDFERGFICAETVSYSDFVTYKGESGAKEAGKFRQEGRGYLIQDGDIFHFRFNV